MKRRPVNAPGADNLLAELNEIMDRSRVDAYRGVLQHWAPRLEKHGLPGSADAAKGLASLLADAPPTKVHDRDWWIRHADEMGDALGREIAIAHVRKALISLLEDQEKSIRSKRAKRR